MVEHFREIVASLLDGKVKAMVVVGSRVEAVRWQLAIDAYIKTQGYKIGVEYPKLQPMDEAGGGEVREKEKACLTEIIAKVNALFDRDITDNDKLVYVNNVIKGKLLDLEILVKQAAIIPNSNSPDFAARNPECHLDVLLVYDTMSKQALESEKVRNGLKDFLLGPAQLYEALKERSSEPGNG